MKLTATKALRYAGRSLVAGDDFEASAKDARLLKAIGKAKDAPVEYAPVNPARASMSDTHRPVKSAYRTRQMKAADVAAETPVADEKTAEE